MSDPTDKLCIDAWGVWQTLRRFGYDSADIFVQVADCAITGSESLFVVLRADGKQFAFKVGHLVDSEEDTLSGWVSLAERVSSGAITNDELSKMYERSIMGRFDNVVALADAMRNKGYRIKALES